MRDGRRLAAVAWLSVGLAASAAPAAAEGEYQLKGAFLFNFAKFVTWPGSAFGDDGELAVCLLGSDAVRDALAATLDGRVASDRPVRVRKLADPGSAAGCHILFATREAGLAPGDLAATGPTLLVGESPGFATTGGMINFVEAESRIRFEVNPAAVRAAGLSVSARLLKLATVVGE